MSKRRRTERDLSRKKKTILIKWKSKEEPDMKLRQSLVYEEKKSKFLAYCYEISGEEENKTILETLKKENPKARHLLHASRFPNHFSAMVSEMSEDREPVSSMKKTKDILERKDIRNVGIYIVRYYGGTNLGASRLDHVYFSLAMKVLGN